MVQEENKQLFNEIEIMTNKVLDSENSRHLGRGNENLAVTLEKHGSKHIFETQYCKHSIKLRAEIFES